MAIIYHITSESAWEAALATGSYRATSLETEGFIHCSDAGQVKGVLNRYFEGMDNLLQLVIDTDLLKHPLKYEISETLEEPFPHIYGPLNVDAVIAVARMGNER